MRLAVIIPGVLFVVGLALTGCRNSPVQKPSDRDRINYTDNSGRKQGPWEIRKDSVLVASGNYRNGKPDGLWTYRYPNGFRKEEGRYDHGVKTGMWVEWYPDGDLMWKGEYVKGKRHIGDPSARAEINFIGEVPGDNILQRNHTYRMRIRIQNVPSSNLFVESAEGSITREEETGLFILNTTEDTLLTLAIGFIPELEFRDFRNLVTEVNYKIR